MPAIEFLIVFEREEHALVLGLEEQTVRLEVRPFDVGDVAEVDNALRLRRALGTASVHCPRRRIHASPTQKQGGGP